MSLIFKSGLTQSICTGSFAVLSLVAATALTALSGRAEAQERKWWESIPGFGNATAQRPTRTSAERRKPEPLNDLRTGPTPLRSDVMIEQMDKAIARYREIVRRGGWPSIGKSKHLRPGEDSELIPIVRKRLVASGDIPVRAANYYSGSYNFDEWLEFGVKAFQKRHGLRVTGRLDRPTRAQLAVSAQARLGQLELNRRRIAELTQGRVEDRYVLVNVPGFQLEAVERFEVKRRHRVIVGKPNRQTPAISATIKALNFFPYWKVPDSVAKLDLVPRLQKEPEYLEKEHIRTLKDYFGGPEIDRRAIDWNNVDIAKVKFRQDPGPWNALGLVRIDMPNKDIVYMHDTPLKPLFGQRDRAFSAGCVRVENVMDFVAWIAKYEPGFSDPSAIQRILEQGHSFDPSAGRPKEFDVTLVRPIPVHFTYITAWVEEDGHVEFRPDIYGRDGAAELVGDADPDAPPPPVMLSP